MKKILISYFLVVLFWSVYRFGVTAPEWFDELVMKPVVWLGILVSFYGINRVIKGEGLKKRKLFTGLGLGSTLFVYHWFLMGGRLRFEINFVWINLIISLATAIVEEIAFRKVWFEELMKENTKIKAFLLNLLMFLIIHLPLYLSSHSSMGTVVSLSVWLIISGSVFLSAYLLGGLTSSTAAHLVWNFLLVTVH